MTTAELVEILLELPATAVVFIDGAEDEHWGIAGVQYDHGEVIIDADTGDHLARDH